MKLKKWCFLVFVFLFEILLLYVFRQPILDMVTFLASSSETIYDDLWIGIVASILFSGLQLINEFVVDATIMFSNKIYVKILQTIFKCTKKHLKSANERMMGFVFSSDPMWGVYQQSEVHKIANTAEGIIACTSAISAGYLLTDHQKKQLKKSIDVILRELDENGLKSYNENKYTVHCTAMGLYAIKSAINVELFELTDAEEDIIRKCARNLLCNANDKGWGFENRYYADSTDNRALSTLWALRALNAWNFGHLNRYCEILKNFIGHSKGLIGFADEHSGKSSTIALLYILVNEITTKKSRDIVLPFVNEEKMKSYLIKNLQNEIEVEEFIVSKRDVRKLPWTHFSECLTYEALSYSLKDFGFYENIKVYFHLGRTLRKIDANKNFYFVKSMAFNNKNPFFYPTTYLIMATSSLLSRVMR